MSDTPEHESHRRPHAPPTAGPFMEFDLPAEIHRLHAETTWSTGHNARTLIKYDDFRVVVIALQAVITNHCGHNHPFVNPARRNPVTTYGHARISRHSKPDR